MKTYYIFALILLMLASVAYADAPIWSVVGQMGGAEGTYDDAGGSTYREILNGSYINYTTSYARIQFKGNTGDGMCISSASICVQNASTIAPNSYSCKAGTNRTLYFSGVRNWSERTIGLVTSDSIQYPINNTVNYLISYYLCNTSDLSSYNGAPNGLDLTKAGDNVDIASGAGYASNGGRILGLYAMLTPGIPTVSTSLGTSYNSPFNVSINVSSSYEYSMCAISLNDTGIICGALNMSYCVQPTANQTSSCGGFSNGTYRLNVSDDYLVGGFSSAIDDDWSTYYNINPDVYAKNLFINYSLPIRTYLPESVWQVKTQYGFQNFSLNSCGAVDSTLVLKFSQPYNSQVYSAYCMDSSRNWITFYDWVITGLYSHLIYEESVFWRAINTIDTQTVACVNSGAVDKSFLFNVTCNGTLYGEQSSATYPFYFDTVLPVVTSAVVVSDNMSYFHKNQNISGVFNWSDSNLYRLNITIDGSSVYSVVGVNNTIYGFKFSKNLSTYNLGSHQLRVAMSDAHTAKKLKETYAVERPLVNDYLLFDSDKNSIKIRPIKKDRLTNPFTYEKLDDRYTFTYNPGEVRDFYSFEVITGETLDVVSNPQSRYKKWLVSGDNWIDFYNPYEPQSEIEIKLDDTLKRAVVTISNLKNPLHQTYQSVGELNTVVLYYNFTTYDATVTYPSQAVEGQQLYYGLNVNFNGSVVGSVAYFTFNGENKSVTATNNTLSTLYNSSFAAPFVNANTNYTGAWFLRVDDSNNTFNVSTMVINIGLSNCSTENASYAKALTFTGKDEETDVNTTFLLNVNFDLWTTSTYNYTNIHFEFTGNSTYDICIYPNSTSFNIYSILEYEANGYANRKYYLYNMVLNATHQDVYLYLLNSTKSSEVVETVIDSATADPVAGTYIKHLRYYPGQNVYKVVEISKTDENGKTLGKMVLADVFYKFILEYPAGTVKLETDVQKILSLTKTFSFTTTTDALATWKDVQNVGATMSCTESTSTCRVSWSDTKNVVQTVRLLVYQDTGYSKILLYNATSTSAAGSLAYTIPSVQNNTRYAAYAELVGSDGLNYMIGNGEIYNEVNPFTSDTSSRVGWMIPLAVLVIALSAAFVDFGTVGIVIGSLLALIVGMVTRIMPFSLTWTITFIILGGILVFKLKGSEAA